LLFLFALTTAKARSLTETSNRSAGAIRMKRMRDRRQRGFRCFQIEVSKADLDALVARGFLDRMRRNEPGAVERAIGGLLDNLYRL
jgi:hypothetical protein